MKFVAAAFLLLVAACGGSADGRSGVVEVSVPTPRINDAAIETLKPRPTPEPTPTPVLTPAPTPGMPPPQGSSITAASGTQQGASSSFCWTSVGYEGCRDFGPPSQPGPLTVANGETVLLKIAAARPPNKESLRPFQGGSREGYPAQDIDPALETSLTVDLAAGGWQLDLCATWNGNGQVCWLFEVFIPEG